MEICRILLGSTIPKGRRSRGERPGCQGGTELIAERVKFRKSRFDTSHQFVKTSLGSDYYQGWAM